MQVKAGLTQNHSITDIEILFMPEKYASLTEVEARLVQEITSKRVLH